MKNKTKKSDVEKLKFGELKIDNENNLNNNKNHNNKINNNNKNKIIIKEQQSNYNLKKPSVKDCYDHDYDDEESDSTESLQTKHNYKNQTKTNKSTILIYDENAIGDSIDNNDNQTDENLYAFLRVDNKHYYLNCENESNEVNLPPDNKLTVSIPIKKGKRKTPLSICATHTRYKLIPHVARSLGWKVLRESQHWNILWTDTVPGVDVYKEMKRFQKVNHFPGMVEICRKDLLARNLGRMLKLFPNDYNIFPKTWCFPADLGDAINYSKEHKQKTFILKPDQGAQGRGIWLTKNLKDTIKPTERLICQVYINRPLLIDGYKFDLRIYTLVTTVDPLRIFVYNEGLVRFATSKYREPTENNTSDLFMHLTNYSVNKHSEQFRHDLNDGHGSKRKFSSLNCSLYNAGLDIKELWCNIDDTIIKTILSSWPMLKHNYRACFPSHDVMQACFEILGFDILVDSNLKPYILEVNHSPSFHTDEQIDKEVKESLIRDTLNLLNISLVDKRKIINEDKRRVKMRLLKKITKPNLSNQENNDNIANIISPLGQQIAWEESHLGGFRRIMPAHSDQLRYTQFFHLQNIASIYSDTAASKRREEASKEFRNALIEREKKNLSLKVTTAGRQNIQRRLLSLSSPIVRNKNQNQHADYLKNKEWSAGSLTNHDYDERERTSSLMQREHLIRTSGVFEYIYQQFFELNLLSDTDCKKYYDYYDKLMDNRSVEKASVTEDLFENLYSKFATKRFLSLPSFPMEFMGLQHKSKTNFNNNNNNNNNN